MKATADTNEEASPDHSENEVKEDPIAESADQAENIGDDGNDDNNNVESNVNTTEQGGDE